MKLDDYRKSKYKDDTPVATVKRIKDILNKLGIEIDFDAVLDKLDDSEVAKISGGAAQCRPEKKGY